MNREDRVRFLIMTPSEPHANAEPDFDEEQPHWDADDPRRQEDCFAPPKDPCECACLHCGRTFMSDQIWFQRVIGDPAGFTGFWMCPTSNCDGAGFTFDIFPTDPNHPANEGWVYDDEDGIIDDESADEGIDAEYDPDESKYKLLDEQFGDEDDDIEGEEWKHGTDTGAANSYDDTTDEAMKAWDEQEKMYDQPDERPRLLDWSNRQDRSVQTMGEDEIPF